MKLVIVESPTKCHTVEKYLGKDYKVVASCGHVTDLATSGKGGLGVDIDNGFKPKYVINKDKYNIVRKLNEEKKQADEVILATDPDREGEAIAWHLANVLKLPVESTKRLEFHEITRDAVSEAILNPRTINLDLVESQETRRILDRIIGFKLSTLLKRKIRSQSAGRVQSATLKVLGDHQKEIDSFIPEEYWNILTNIDFLGTEKNLTFISNKKDKIVNEEQANAILNAIPDKLTIKSIDTTTKITESKPAFKTSTLQQEAYKKLGFKTKKTATVAQELFYGVNLGNEVVGLITYMRTDDTKLSDTYVNKANNFILETYGKDYLGKVKVGARKANEQDAHEAIRPTSNHRTPESVRQYLTRDQFELYRLIYNRAVGSLMKAKVEDVMTVVFEGNGYEFKTEYSKTKFKGYEILNTKQNKEIPFPEVSIGQEFNVISKEAEQKFTTPPSLYTEAKIVQIMEELGIGRPSTYANTIETLSKRKYITNEKGVLSITEKGKETLKVLEEFFPDIVSSKYTAEMETNLDEVAQGEESRVQILTEFYGPFIDELEVAEKEMGTKVNFVPTGENCPLCGSPLVYRQSRDGKQFIGCSNFPKCHYIKKEEKPKPKETGELCPLCGKPLVERVNKKGKVFVACSGYPKCRYIKNDQPEKKPITEADYVKPCPKCGGHLIKRQGKDKKYFLGCTNYPKCKYHEPYEEENAK